LAAFLLALTAGVAITCKVPGEIAMAIVVRASRAIEKCLIHVTPRERSCGERRDAKPVVREAEQKALSQHARAPTLCGEVCRRQKRMLSA
jgi:hypothetical protein